MERSALEGTTGLGLRISVREEGHKEEAEGIKGGERASEGFEENGRGKSQESSDTEKEVEGGRNRGRKSLPMHDFLLVVRA